MSPGWPAYQPATLGLWEIQALRLLNPSATLVLLFVKMDTLLDQRRVVSTFSLWNPPLDALRGLNALHANAGESSLQ